MIGIPTPYSDPSALSSLMWTFLGGGRCGAGDVVCGRVDKLVLGDGACDVRVAAVDVGGIDVVVRGVGWAAVHAANKQHATTVAPKINRTDIRSFATALKRTARGCHFCAASRVHSAGSGHERELIRPI
jgi:hypothetical protein